MRNLSSSWTWFYKFAFPTLWIGGFGLGTVAMFVAPDSWSADPREVRWLFLALLLAGTSIIYWSAIRVKKVALDVDSLLISNFRRELRVPLHNVKRVSGSIFWHPELIWLHFRYPTDFGPKVLFIAPMRFFGFGEHPLARELQALVSGQDVEQEKRPH
jgi:hypothetical protein